MIDKEYIQQFYKISLFGNESDSVTAAAKRAYRDFCRTVNFTNKKSGHSEAIKDVVSVIREKLKIIPEIQSKESYDKWHDDLHKEIKDAFADATLTVGQIQKWINMTMKYLIVLDEKKVERVEPFLHVPIDSIVLKKSKNPDFFKEKETNKVLPWSQIDDYDQYMEFQKKIRIDHNEPPILWEFKAWNTADERQAACKKKVQFEKYNYYNGEEQKPFEPDSAAAKFWHGEMMYDQLQDKDYFTQEAKKWRKDLEESNPDCTILLYNDVTLGIILYTQCLFGKFCPYGSFNWIFEYKTKPRKEKPEFYKRLSSHGKKHYDAHEKTHPHSERFIELMNQRKKSEGADKWMFYNEEERDFLGHEDLVTLHDLHPGDADFYMMCD